ncbi:unnamed protein product [Prunus armeniaca]|uniref:Pentatricopeptide repeat-containing protein n=2 Tax=Prunus armeniaca TaxID=36596 RepID=A0A6J5U060_PRUAR|nr:unnamed protein product [Prunus armeniaca]
MSTLHSRGYSIGSFHEEDLRRSSENYFKDLSGSGSEEDQLGNKELGPASLRSDVKPASLAKASLRGRSVRTIRPSRLTTDDKVEKMCDNGGAISMRKDIIQNGGTDKKFFDNVTGKLDLGNSLHMPKPTIPKYQKKEMQEFHGNVVAEESEDDSESEAENFLVSSEDEDADPPAAAAATCNSVNVAGPDSEVDKKAGEFIAKFREQIRLQKVASLDRSRGLGTSGNCFRDQKISDSHIQGSIKQSSPKKKKQATSSKVQSKEYYHMATQAEHATNGIKRSFGCSRAKKGISSNAIVYNTLTGVFCISNQVEEAEGLFAEMKSKGTAACHLQYSNGCTQQKVAA